MPGGSGIRPIEVVLALAALLVGCASTPPGDADPANARAGPPSSVASGPGAPRRFTPRDLPPPPGVDARLLVEAGAANGRARASLDDAIAFVRSRVILPSPADPPPAPPVTNDLDDALRHYVKGRDEALQGRWLVAITDFEKARQLDPGSPEILRELAHAYASFGNAGRAAAVHQEILRLDPDSSESSFLLGLAAAGRRKHEAAVALLGRRALDPEGFTHDPAAGVLADLTLHRSLARLGYDRAAIETGRRAAEVSFALNRETAYRQRLASLFRRRGGTLRAVGDAHCRLGEYDEALDAYAAASELPIPDPVALRARKIYANLRVGDEATARDELLSALRETGTIDDRQVHLCEYAAQHFEDIGPAAAEIIAAYRESPDDVGLARAAAVFLPPDEARELLRAFVAARPRDVGVLGQLLSWLGGRDASAAEDVTADLLAAHLDLADEYVARLVWALPNPARHLAEAGAPATPAHVGVRARMDVMLWDLGGAWSRCARGLERWPSDPALRALRLELAGRLDEPALVDEAWQDLAQDAGPRDRVLLARALADIGEFDRAEEVAREAIEAADEADGHRVEARMALAEALAVAAEEMPIDEQRGFVFRRAVAAAEEARALDARHEAPDAFLARLYGPGGSLAHPERYRELLARVRRELGGTAIADRLLGWEALQRGRHERALEIALGRLEEDPTDRECIRIAVTAWEQLGRADDAERWLRERLDATGADPATLDALMRLLLTRERADAARTLLERLREEHGDGPALRRMRETVEQVDGRLDRAVALGEHRLLAGPAGTRRALQLALLYAQGGRTDDALAELEKIADPSASPSSRHLTGAIGLCARLDTPGRESRLLAADLVERLVESRPGTVLPVYAVGIRALAEAGLEARLDDLVRHATRHARGASDPSPQAVLPWRDLAQALVDADRVPAAYRALRIRLDTLLAAHEPPDRDAITLLVSMILATRVTAPDGAEQSFGLLVDLDARGIATDLPLADGPPTLAREMSAAAQLFSLLGGEEGAEFLMRRAIDLDPTDALMLNNLGYQRLERGIGDAETVALIERAAALTPDSASVLDTVGWLRYKQGRIEDTPDGEGALSLIQRAIEAAEEPSPEVLDHHGDALWRRGETAAAIGSWREAAALLEDSGRRERMVASYLAYQGQGWGLVVVDPAALYDRDVAPILERTRRKLAEAEQGGSPPIAATFEELAPLLAPDAPVSDRR